MSRAEEILKEMEENLNKNKELVKELKQIESEVNVSPYWNEDEIRIKDHYYVVTNVGSGVISEWKWDNDDADRRYTEANNCYKDKKYAQFKADERQLLAEMDKFSWENGGADIDWEDEEVEKYHVIYRNDSGIVCVRGTLDSRNIGNVYFADLQTANRAVKIFGDRIKDLCKREVELRRVEKS